MGLKATAGSLDDSSPTTKLSTAGFLVRRTEVPACNLFLFSALPETFPIVGQLRLRMYSCMQFLPCLSFSRCFGVGTFFFSLFRGGGECKPATVFTHLICLHTHLLLVSYDLVLASSLSLSSEYTQRTQVSCPLSSFLSLFGVTPLRKQVSFHFF